MVDNAATQEVNGQVPPPAGRIAGSACAALAAEAGKTLTTNGRCGGFRRHAKWPQA